MEYPGSARQQDFCFVIRLNYPGGFKKDKLSNGAERWLVHNPPEPGYASTGINFTYSGWRKPKNPEEYLFDNKDRITFVHSEDDNYIVLWGTRSKSSSLGIEKLEGLGSSSRLALEKALIFYGTRIYLGSFTVERIQYQTPLRNRTDGKFEQLESIEGNSLNQPFADRTGQIQLSEEALKAENIFNNQDRFQQPLLVALKNFMGSTSSDAQSRFNSSWQCLNTIYSSIFQRPMTSESRRDSDAQTLRYLIKNVFIVDSSFDKANQLVSDFIMHLNPRRVIKLANDSSRKESQFVDNNSNQFKYPEIEKFNYAWRQLNDIVPYSGMIDRNGNVFSEFSGLLTHFSQPLYHEKSNGDVNTYPPEYANIKEKQYNEIKALADDGDLQDSKRTAYERYRTSIEEFKNVIHNNIQSKDDVDHTMQPVDMLVQIFFNYVRVLRNNYFHGGYGTEDFLINDTSNQEEIKMIANILREYDRVLLNKYSNELSSTSNGATGNQ